MVKLGFIDRFGQLFSGTKRLPAPDYTRFSHKHLLDVDTLTVADVQTILDCAEHYVERNRNIDKKHSILKGRTLINLFFENSTRTRTSFEIAGKRLGMDVINISGAQSSVKKGETLQDTARTLNAMQADVIVMRHDQSGAAQMLSRVVDAAVINAGDGQHAHPTQALLDALTIRTHKKQLHDLKVVLCGDVLHSRVARSNILLLKKMGAKVTIVAPSTLLPATAQSLGVKITSDMQEGLDGADVVMMLRLQMERMQGTFFPSVREYFNRYGLSEAKLAYAKPDALVMHPGPVNRGVEIESKIADHIERSVILQQVELGVAVRQALLELMCK
jgi:aspartate carbamoyltransferase catalytic subunit